jgi:DNA-directed RNA polymerase subunit RPC12/RpoP
VSTKLLLLLGGAAVVAATAMIFVPMAVGVGYMSAVTQSLWEVFGVNAIFVLLPVILVTGAPLIRGRYRTWWIPLVAGLIGFAASLGMTIEFFLWNGGARSLRWDFGFDPRGIAFLLVVALLLFAEGVVGRSVQERMERLRAGRCPECGYDLRATPVRCPECGMRSVKID